jgi:hypothetical protein
VSALTAEVSTFRAAVSGAAVVVSGAAWIVALESALGASVVAESLHAAKAATASTNRSFFIVSFCFVIE